MPPPTSTAPSCRSMAGCSPERRAADPPPRPLRTGPLAAAVRRGRVERHHRDGPGVPLCAPRRHADAARGHHRAVLCARRRRRAAGRQPPLLPGPLPAGRCVPAADALPRQAGAVHRRGRTHQHGHGDGAGQPRHRGPGRPGPGGGAAARGPGRRHLPGGHALADGGAVPLPQRHGAHRGQRSLPDRAGRHDRHLPGLAAWRASAPASGAPWGPACPLRRGGGPAGSQSAITTPGDRSGARTGGRLVRAAVDARVRPGRTPGSRAEVNGQPVHGHDHKPGSHRVGSHGSGHTHVGSTAEGELSARRRRALWISLAANGGFMFAEVAGGLVFGSLALLADAAHMLSDVAGLAIALLAQRLVERPASARHTFGLQRAEALGAQANGVLLLVTAGWIFFEAFRRLQEPADVAGGGLLVVATLGLAVNLVSAVLLARASGRSLNMRGAYVHMLADAASSVGAIAAGVAVLLFGVDWVDPAVSILIGVLVLWSAWGLLRDTTHVLLEGSPRHLDPDEVERTLAALPAVASVHHLHLWNLSSETPALSAHVVLDGQMSLHQAQVRGDALKLELSQRWGIAHATLELECHDCEPEPPPPPGS